MQQKPLIACVEDDVSAREPPGGFLKAFGFSPDAFSSAEDPIRITELIRHCGEETAMHTVVGPVVVTRDGGFGFDLWTPEEGLSRGFSYRRIEDAYYARKVEIRSRIRSLARPMVACSTVDEFASALAEL